MHDAAYHVGEPVLLPYFPHEPRGKTPFSENIVHNAECEIVREIGGAFNTEMPDEHYRLRQIFENIIDRRLQGHIYCWNVWKRYLCGCPARKDLFKLRNQGFGIKITGNREHHIVRMIILRMKRFEILNRDAFYPLNFRIPPEWMSRPVE